jgi:hypothetical protein
MNESNYLKCACQNCGEPIEFPIHGIGSAVACPHCHRRTTLRPPSTPEATDKVSPALSEEPDFNATTHEGASGASKCRGRLVAIALVMILAGTATAVFIHRDQQKGSISDEIPDAGSAGDVSRSSQPGASQPPAGKSPTATHVPKAAADLKVGSIALEKAKGSSLVYAVGVLRNDSDHQRFGVNIELELHDAKGNKAGVAKDYRSVIEPRQEWRFRALVLDSKAVSAILSSIREEE